MVKVGDLLCGTCSGDVYGTIVAHYPETNTVDISGVRLTDLVNSDHEIDYPEYVVTLLGVKIKRLDPPLDHDMGKAWIVLDTPCPRNCYRCTKAFMLYDSEDAESVKGYFRPFDWQPKRDPTQPERIEFSGGYIAFYPKRIVDNGWEPYDQPDPRAYIPYSYADCEERIQLADDVTLLICYRKKRATAHA